MVRRFGNKSKQRLRELFSPVMDSNWILDKDIEKYTQDWQDQYGGVGSVVLLPRTTQQVSKIMEICTRERIAVVPQSGNTSLVAGATPVHDEVVLSVSKMDKILGFDENSGVLSVESGCILQNAISYLEPKGFCMPYDLGARGSCLIGGNLSTNAAGIHFVKYGSLRNYVLGLEVVLANGKVLDMLGELRKDNTGMDLKQAFIGSEGTLGIITQAKILCPKKDKHTKLVFIKCRGFHSILGMHRKAREILGKNLSAIEYLDWYTYYICNSVQKNLRFPYDPKSCPKDTFFLLVETSGASEEELEAQILGFCEQVEDLAEDVLLPKNMSDERNFWEIRERVAESCNKMGHILKYDFSISISLNEEFLEGVRKIFGEKAEMVTGYGHIGDGNIHMNVLVNSKYNYQEVAKAVDPQIMELLIRNRGSISAEHGIGTIKAEFLEKQKSSDVYKVMRDLKTYFDPLNILNPGKVFR